MELIAGIIGLIMILCFFCIYTNSYKGVAAIKNLHRELQDVNAELQATHEEIHALREDLRWAADSIVRELKK